jgi:ATP-binding cassette subfamily C protein
VTAAVPRGDQSRPSSGWSATELGRALLPFRSAGVTILLLSVVGNVLALSGSIYLMLVYDRVLPSHSIPSLVSLFAILIVLYVFQGVFDGLRARMLQMIGEGLDHRLTCRLQELEADLAARRVLGALPAGPMRDLDQIRGFLASPGPAAIIDLPWIVFFLAFLWLLHPLLSLTAFAGALVLGLATYLNDRDSRANVESIGTMARQQQARSDRLLQNIDTITGLGVRRRMSELSVAARRELVHRQGELARSLAKYGALGRTLRMFVQSAVLTTGAVLVIRGEASVGVIFASSILAGRALAPVDQAIANWRTLVSARQAWGRLVPLMEKHPPRDEPALDLPAPAAKLAVEHLAVIPPGAERPVVSWADFTLAAGDALAVIGASGSGKSSLVRALVNVWPAAQGSVRLDGAALGQYREGTLRAAIGYLPQEVELFGGTVAENISRSDPNPSSPDILKAAMAADVHDFILSLPQGYDTPLGDRGIVLSAGQRQRLALARALYGEPFVLVLDEPDSNLDSAGEIALAGAITGARRRGGIVVVVTHRVALLNQVTHLLVMRDGRQDALGPRDEVLATLKSHANAASMVQPGGAEGLARRGGT